MKAEDFVQMLYKIYCCKSGTYVVLYTVRSTLLYVYNHLVTLGSDHCQRQHNTILKTVKNKMVKILMASSFLIRTIPGYIIVLRSECFTLHSNRV